MPNYTATIPTVPTVNEDGATVFNILFTPDDGSAATTLEWITIDPNTLQKAVSDKIGELQDQAAMAANNAAIAANMKAFLASFTPGQVITPPLSPALPTPTAQDQYQMDVQSLQQLIKEKTAMGIDITQDPDVQALQSIVTNEYDPSFVMQPATLSLLNTAKLANKSLATPK